jgi:hypothetical protein
MPPRDSTGGKIEKLGAASGNPYYLRAMILCSVDQSGRVFTIGYHGHIKAVDMQRGVATIKELAVRLKPGFLLLTDLTNLQSMDASCAPLIGTAMELFSAKGIARVARVMPDANKDIGFSLIGHFHLHPSVTVQTHPTLADAVESFLCEERLPAEIGAHPSDDSRQIPLP